MSWVPVRVRRLSDSLAKVRWMWSVVRKEGNTVFPRIVQRGKGPAIAHWQAFPPWACYVHTPGWSLFRGTAGVKSVSVGQWSLQHSHLAVLGKNKLKRTDLHMELNNKSGTCTSWVCHWGVQYVLDVFTARESVNLQDSGCSNVCLQVEFVSTDIFLCRVLTRHRAHRSGCLLKNWAG